MNFSPSDIFDRLSSYAESNTDVAIAKLLGISRQAIANARKRNTVPFEKICDFAINNGISLDYLLLGKTVDADHGRDVDITLLDAIEIAFEDYRHNHQIYGIDCYAHDLGLIYNRVIKSIKPGENWAKIVEQEVRYLMEIRRSDKLRDNTSTTPLVVHEEEQRLLKKHGMTVKDAYGEECVNPIEQSKNVVTQTIEGNNHQISGRDLINKGKK